MDTPLSGILPYLYSIGNQAKRQIYGLLGDPASFAGSVAQDLQTSQDERRKALTTLLSPGVFTTPQEQAAAQNALTNEAMNLLGITVWHGSPHKFDKFDSSKIGTGEGAQAYGHGLYFAEKPQVAMEYKKNLSYKDAVKQFRQELPDDADFEEVLALAASGQVSAPKARVIKELSANDWLGFDYPAQAITAAFRDKAGFHDMTPSLRKAIDEYGNLYKVDLPDSMAAKMLDWDKPLSQQPEAVRKALEDAPGWPFIKQFIERDFTRNVPTGVEPTGQALHEVLSGRMGGQNKSSDYFQGLGIPGIRYLDAGSRALPETELARIAKLEEQARHYEGLIRNPPSYMRGNEDFAGWTKQRDAALAAIEKIKSGAERTHNYVVFPGEEGLLNILERNGVPLQGLLGK